MLLIYSNPTPDEASESVADPEPWHDVQWEPVTPQDMQYLLINSSTGTLQLEVRRHLFGKEVALWNSLIPGLSSMELQDDIKSRAEPFDSKTWVFFGLTVALLCLVVFLLCLIVWGNKKGQLYSQLIRGASATSYSVNL